MTVQGTDIIVVNRNDTTYHVQQSDLMAKLEDTDLLLVNRNGATFKVLGSDFKDSLGGGEVFPGNESGAPIGGIMQPSITSPAEGSAFNPRYFYVEFTKYEKNPDVVDAPEFVSYDIIFSDDPLFATVIFSTSITDIDQNYYYSDIALEDNKAYYITIIYRSNSANFAITSVSYVTDQSFLGAERELNFYQGAETITVVFPAEHADRTTITAIKGYGEDGNTSAGGPSHVKVMPLKPATNYPVLGGTTVLVTIDWSDDASWDEFIEFRANGNQANFTVVANNMSTEELRNEYNSIEKTRAKLKEVFTVYNFVNGGGQNGQPGAGRNKPGGAGGPGGGYGFYLEKPPAGTVDLGQVPEGMYIDFTDNEVSGHRTVCPDATGYGQATWRDGEDNNKNGCSTYTGRDYSQGGQGGMPGLGVGGGGGGGGGGGVVGSSDWQFQGPGSRGTGAVGQGDYGYALVCIDKSVQATQVDVTKLGSMKEAAQPGDAYEDVKSGDIYIFNGTDYNKFSQEVTR